MNDVHMDTLMKEFSMSCRGCNNSSKKMKDMFEFCLDEDFYKLTNIQINKSDNLSKLLCTECEEVIQNCRKFRKQCQQTDFLLNILIKKTSGDATELKLFDDKSSKNTLSYCLRDTTLIIKVTAPDIKENICYNCPQKCHERFKKKSDLHQHMTRRHNMSNDFGISVQYYCAVPNCHYHISSTSAKFFTGRKYLNQHIHKVHKGKTSCEICHLNFTNSNEYERHLTSCNLVHTCQICHKEYKVRERLVVHLMRKHPEEHKKYKIERKSGRRKALPVDLVSKNEEKSMFSFENSKISSATQTLKLDQNIRNDVTLPSWQKTDETKKDEISTQTAFEELFKSQSDEYSLFYTESVSDIQTQTAPLEFGLSRSNKETITSETQSPDLSIKETQTCLCLYDSHKTNFKYDSMVNPFCMTSAETQTLGMDTDLLSFSSAETQTCFDEDLDKGF